jgi:hypothetical protein
MRSRSTPRTITRALLAGWCLCTGSATSFAQGTPPAKPKDSTAQKPATPAVPAQRAQRITLTDEWVMSQQVVCGEVRGRFRSVALTNAADTLLRPVSSARARLIAPDVLKRKHLSDSASYSRDDGVFQISAAVAGLWRLEITRDGLPDVVVPLDFGSGRGYVIDIAIGATHPSDERWGAIYHIARPARGCDRIPVDVSMLKHLGLLGGRFERVSQIIGIADVTTTVLSAVAAKRRAHAAHTNACSAADGATAAPCQARLPARDSSAVGTFSRAELLHASRAALLVVLRDVKAPTDGSGERTVCVQLNDGRTSAPADSVTLHVLTTPGRRAVTGDRCTPDSIRATVTRTEEWTHDLVAVTVARQHASTTAQWRCAVRREREGWIAACEAPA